MNDFLARLQAVDLTSGAASREQHESLMNMIDELCSDDNWQICANFIISELEKCSSQQQVNQFQHSTAVLACCRCIEKLLNKSISMCPVSSVEVHKMTEFLRKWVKLYVYGLGGHIKAVFIRRKIAQCVCLAVMRYYPNVWPTVFDEFLSLFTEVGVNQLRAPLSDSNPMLLNLLEVFLEFLQELDSMVFDRHLNLTDEQYQITSQIKDSMRANCLPLITEMLALVLKTLQPTFSREMELISLSLKVIGKYVLWIDINLIANEQFIDILRSLVQINEFKIHQSICILLKFLFAKGMQGFVPKLSLVSGLWPQLLQPLIDAPMISKVLRNSSIRANANNGYEEQDSEEFMEYLREFANCIWSVGQNLLESFRGLISTYLPNNSTQDISLWQAAFDECKEKLETIVNVAVSLLAYQDDDVGLAVVMFLEDYLDLFKGKSTSRQGPSKVTGKVEIGLELTEGRIERLRHLFNVLMSKVKYPANRTAEEIERFESDRGVFVSLMRKMVIIDCELVLEGIKSLLQQTIFHLPPNLKVEEIRQDVLDRLESCLFVFFAIGESLKPPKNDYFTPGYAYAHKMNDIMSIICCSNISAIAYYPLQLNFFEIIGRYEKFFTSSPKILFDVLAAFLDERGLRNPNIKVRSRCAYLFSRIIKSFKSVVAPHSKDILQRLENLLSLDPAPDLLDPKNLNGCVKLSSISVLGAGAANSQPRLFSITEQSFLYEAAALLINAHISISTTNGVQEGVHLYTILLQPALNQFPDMVCLLAEEKNPDIAEARGVVIKQTADLITRTIRVMTQQGQLHSEYVDILMRILDVMVSSLPLLPSVAGAPGRAAACAGIRAYIHRLISTIKVDCDVAVNSSISDDSAPVTSASINGCSGRTAPDILLMAINKAAPHFIAVQRSTDLAVPEQDPDIRWKELREHIPLFTQLPIQYKERCLPVLSQCLPPLIATTMNALTEPLEPNHSDAVLERSALRRTLLQLLQTIGQVLPQGILVALGADAPNILVSLVRMTECCLDSNDATGMRYGFSFFLSCIKNFGADETFYKEFLLPHLLPLAFLAPARPNFLLTDAQFTLALNEAASCIYALNSAKADVFQEFLLQTLFPQENLSPNHIELYMTNLRTKTLPQFQAFAKHFYSLFR